MKTINVVVNDSEQTYKQTDDDDELAPKVTIVPEVTVADALVADTRVVVSKVLPHEDVIAYHRKNLKCISKRSPLSVHDKHFADNAVENVETAPVDEPFTSAHSDERSSSEDIFVPTPGHPSITNKVGQSERFPPVKSLVRVDSSVDDQCSVSDLDLVGDSTVNLGGNIVIYANENLTKHVDAHDKPTENYAPDNV
ncbi:uncharacterized protein E5676_scaffold83126G00010 [Cucumis melo var. makuwa]|uniref:Envelope-like protein n=1 Tax=Cucumis melo var. makuwa TaxID=1194695 RepID=A0A5D3DH34_CUCMM|nr:uncharacterized protein E5676_scaffold83126G00010 [Cucumis melo var. makuwa]